MRQVDAVAAGRAGGIKSKAARSYPPYPAYRLTGVEWLPEVPAHWDVRRLKTFAQVYLSNVDKKSVEGEDPIKLCNYVDVYHHERITPDLEFMPATASSDQIGRLSLHRGDVLITKDSETPDDIAVASVVDEDLPGVVCGYHLALIRPDVGKMNGRYLARALASVGPRDQFHVAANGVTRFGLSSDAIASAVLPLPPYDEQGAIGAFLDRETARIDALVAKKERLIDLLQEKRTALITRAVTKGLDPNVPMKNSGVEWLGEIPEDWDCLALARITESRCDGPFGSGLKSEHYSAGGVRVVRLQNIGWTEFSNADEAYIDEEYARELGDHGVRAGDLLIAGLGDEGHPVGRACTAPEGIEPAMVKADCFRFRLNRARVLPRFAAYQLSATAVAAAGSLSTGATRSRMNLTAMAARKIALPPLDGQRAIISELEQEAKSYERVVHGVSDAVSYLKELRTALISAAVTGKIDVRGEAA